MNCSFEQWEKLWGEKNTQFTWDSFNDVRKNKNFKGFLDGICNDEQTFRSFYYFILKNPVK